MIKLDKWLKSMIEYEFELEEQIIEDYGKLSYKGIWFGVGEITNPYLLYKHSFWWRNNSGWGSVSLGNEYNTELLRNLIIEKVGMKKKVLIKDSNESSSKELLKKVSETEKTISLPVEQLPDEDNFTGGIFDFM